MTDGSRVVMSFGRWTEVYSALAQAAPTQLAELPYVDESMKRTKEQVQSQEVRADRQIPGSTETFVGGEGDITTEFKAITYDELVEGLLFCDDDWTTDLGWTEATGLAALTATPASGSTNGQFSGTGVPADLKKGQVFELSGTTLNDGLWVCAADVTGSDVEVYGRVEAETISSGGDIDFKRTEFIENGSNGRHLFDIGKDFQGFADFGNQEQHYYDRTKVNSVALTISPREILQARWNFLAETSERVVDTDPRGGSITPTTSHPSFNAIRALRTFVVGGAAIRLTDVDITIENALRERPAIGIIGSDDIALGTFTITGRIRAYFTPADGKDSRGIVQSYFNDAIDEITWAVQDNNGKGYVFVIPAVKWDDGETIGEGQNTDVVVNQSFQAQIGDVDPTAGGTSTKTLRVYRAAAA